MILNIDAKDVTSSFLIQWSPIESVERNSHSIWFCVTPLAIGLKNSRHFLTTNNKLSLEPIVQQFNFFFPRASCWLTAFSYWIVCFICNRQELLLWYWFYDPQLKTTLNCKDSFHAYFNLVTLKTPTCIIHDLFIPLRMVLT